MSRKKKNRRRKPKQHIVSIFDDITVQEVADNPRAVTKIRSKKYSASVLHRKVVDELPQSLLEQKMADDNSDVEHWYERDLSDFENRLAADPNERDDGTETSQKTEGRRKLRSKETSEEYVGVVYPVDLWYLLANYISPEQVGKFSLLCKDAFYVTTTSAFWKRLYERYFIKGKDLPSPLQRYFIKTNKDCIRANVISALYRFYPAFQSCKILQMLNADGSDSDKLLGATCLFAWNSGRVGKQFHHFIKFRHYAPVREQNMRNSLIQSPSVWGNPNEGEMLMQVTSPAFQHFPLEHIMGLQLAAISVSVGRDMCYNRLKLEFQRTVVRGRHHLKGNKIVVELDPVSFVSAVHWWHPLFQDTLIYGTVNPLNVPDIPSNNVNYWDYWNSFFREDIYD